MQLLQYCKTASSPGKSLPYLAGMNPPSRKQFCCMMYVPLHPILPGPWNWPVKEASGNSPGVLTGVPTGSQQGASRVPAGYVQNPTVPGTLVSSPHSRNNVCSAIVQELHLASLSVICCRLQDMAETSLDILQSCSLAGAASSQREGSLYRVNVYIKDGSFYKRIVCTRTCITHQNCLREGGFIPARYGRTFPGHFAVLQYCRSCIGPAYL